jgi:hypothetical protein
MFLNAPASEGVILGYANALVCSGTVTPIAVATGAAQVYGFPYESDTVVNLAVTTPSVGLTGGHVVLRVNWAAQTVRLFAVRNTDGLSAIPALTQVAGTTWEIRLASFTITTGGVITLTDTRSYCHFNTAVKSSMIDWDAVGPAQIAAGAVSGTELATGSVTAVHIQAGAVGSSQIAADAVTATHIAASAVGSSEIAAGAVGASELAAGAVGTTALANDAVDITKIGTQVIGISGRQGEGTGTNWGDGGTTNFTPGNTRIQVGAYIWAAGGVITFPVAFNKIPVVLITARSNFAKHVTISGIGKTSFGILAWDAAGVATYCDIEWIAIGEE